LLQAKQGDNEVIDIKQIIKNRDLFQGAIARKHVDVDLDRLLAVDQKVRDLQAEVDALRAQRNTLSALTKKIDPYQRETHLKQCADVAEQLGVQEKRLTELNAEFQALMLMVPNPPGDDVPDGTGDADNVEIMRWGEPPQFAFQLKDHIELCRMHGLADFDNAREFAGSRAVALTGDGALLELAVLRFALEKIVEKGFQPVIPPVVVRQSAMTGTGYFPTGRDDAYALERDEMFLAGTSEVPLIAMHANRTFTLEQPPLRLAGVSPCYRREAGAAGRDTRGLYRVHQFQKVEQVVLMQPDIEAAERMHWQLLENAQ
jgi:seryl-tRNA synthetase